MGVPLSTASYVTRALAISCGAHRPGEGPLTGYSEGIVVNSYYTHHPVNEFYKKRCQEKTSASTGGREDSCLEIQPTAVSVPPDSPERFCSGLFAIPVGVHLAMVTTPIESGNLASESWCLQCSTMVLSEARGLSLFPVKRGGIA
jgi:hypothetical protein